MFSDPQGTRELCLYWTLYVFLSSGDQGTLSLFFFCFPILRVPGSFVFIGLCMFSDPQGTRELCLYWTLHVFRSSGEQGTLSYLFFLFSDPHGTRELCLYWTVSVLRSSGYQVTLSLFCVYVFRSSEDQGTLSLLDCVCFPILRGPGNFVFIGMCLFSDPQGTRELCLYWTVSVFRSSGDQGTLFLSECACFPILRGPGSFVFIGMCLFSDPQGTREQWQSTFYVAAGVYVFGAVVYVVFGSGEVQTWAEATHGMEDDEKEAGVGFGLQDIHETANEDEVDAEEKLAERMMKEVNIELK